MKKFIFIFIFIFASAFSNADYVCSTYFTSVCGSTDSPNSLADAYLSAQGPVNESDGFLYYQSYASYFSGYTLKMYFYAVFSDGKKSQRFGEANFAPFATPTPTPVRCANNAGSPIICGQTGTFSSSSKLTSFCSGGCVQNVTSSYLTGFSVDPATKETDYKFNYCYQSTTTQCDGSYNSSGSATPPDPTPNPSSTPNPSAVPSPTNPGASCPEGKSLGYVNGTPYCYTPATTPIPGTTPNPTSKPTKADATSTTSTTTVTNPDGSKTTTIVTTNPDGSSSTTTTTVKPDGSSTSSTKTTGSTTGTEEGDEAGECSKADMKNTIGCQNVKVTVGDKKEFDNSKAESDLKIAQENFKNELNSIKANLRSKFNLNASVSGSPRSYAIPVFGGSFQISMGDFSGYYNAIANMVIAIAYILAVFIILS